MAVQDSVAAPPVAPMWGELRYSGELAQQVSAPQALAAG